jgi:two-component system cell cycle sensor histidine kinase/response regulator CckA
MRSGRPLVNKEESHTDASGVRRTVLTSKFPLKDSRGAVFGLVAISHDITDRQ